MPPMHMEECYTLTQAEKYLIWWKHDIEKWADKKR